jgi:cell wall-associated NlpC family hydrolase
VFTDLAFESDPRGLYRCRYISGRVPYRTAAEHILQTDGTVFLLTGFYILRAHSVETDGLSGSWLLFHALQSLGKTVILPVDDNTGPVLSRLFPSENLVSFPICNHESSRKNASKLLKMYSPDTVIAIERPGPDSGGSFRNANGDDITPFCARMEYLWPPRCLKTAIGDGGNELGMGTLATSLTDGRPICPINADFTLVGSTSDFAAWCLAASLETVTGRELMPDYDELFPFLQQLPRLGVVDGMTGKPDISIDGYPAGIIEQRYRRIQRAARLVRTTQSIIQKTLDDERASHTVPIAQINLRYNSEKEAVHLDGHLLLHSQLKRLKKNVQDTTGSAVLSWPAVLSDPGHTACPWLHVPGRTADLLEQPEGRLATQIADYDQWIRRLYVTGAWHLYQTPDLAMGWSDNPDLSALLGTHPAHNLWHTLVRAFPGTCLNNTLSIEELSLTAAALRGIPYRWGGRNSGGLDCSGMTQRIFFTLGILLPRNSREQRRCGCRIPLRNVCPGDLVFATGKISRLHHAGIVLPDGLQHACLTEKRVIIESMRDFQNRYRIIAVRRISTFA